MFLVGMIRSAKGYVTFRAEGGFPERFLNLAAHAGVNLWGIKRSALDLTAHVSARDYKRLRGPAKRAHTRIRVIRRDGVPFVAHRYRKRWGIPVGALICALAIWYLCGFVWSIEIAGAKQLPSEVILERLKSYGIHEGVRIKHPDYEGIAQRMMQGMDEISFLSMHVRGTRLYVEVRETTPKPEIIDPAEPVNIVAAKTGRIVKLQVYEGQGMVAADDLVLEGDLLVSGVFEDSKGGYTLRHSQATIIARTQNPEEIVIPYDHVVKTPTGVVRNRDYLRLFSFNLPLFLATELRGEHELTGSIDQLEIFGFKLPLWTIKQQYHEVDVAATKLTRAEAHALAMQALDALLLERYADRTVVDTEWEGIAEGDRYRLVVNVICEEDIAEKKPIYFEGRVESNEIGEPVAPQ